MTTHMNFMTPLLVLFFLVSQFAAFPLEGRALPLIRNATSDLNLLPNSNFTSLMPATAPWDDWENFAYQIPQSRLIIKGRVFTHRRLRESALHYLIDGGKAQVQSRIDLLGNIKISNRENPYTYRVPGAAFKLTSKVSRGEPVMTYFMMRDVFEALEEVLEKQHRNLETSFVLTDLDKFSWAHGEVFERIDRQPLSDS